MRFLILCNGFARNPYCLAVQFPYQMFTMIVGHGYTLAAEGIGRDNISPCLQVSAMDILNDIGPCQDQYVIITLHLSGNIQEPAAPEILLRQVVTLNHGAHGTIQQNQFTAF